MAGKLIYTAGVIDKRTYVIAYDTNGRLVWQTPHGEQWVAAAWMVWARSYDGSRATPNFDDGVVYHLNELGHLIALNAQTGREIWSMSLTEHFSAPVPMYGYAENLLVDGNKLICYPGGSNGYMVALDKKTGGVIWANTSIGDQAGYSSAIIVDYLGTRQAVTMTGEAVVGVAIETGRMLWRYPHTNRLRLNIATPVFKDGRVFATSGYGAGSVMLQLSRDGQNINAHKLWSNSELDNHHGGVLVHDGYIYGTGHMNNGWICLDFATGKKMYRTRGVGKGSLVFADSMLYCLGENGTLALVRPSSQKFDIISKFKIPRQGRGAYWSHPVISNGVLYARHNDALYAYDISR